MNSDIERYNNSQTKEYKSVCNLLAKTINQNLKKTESKVWHGHPVWFLEGNPTVGYSIQKPGVRLMFWSGIDFDEAELLPGTGKFKDASIFYTNISQVNADDLKRWLKKAQEIQWDYKNIVKRRGKLVRLN